jgi:hypothetical protein
MSWFQGVLDEGDKRYEPDSFPPLVQEPEAAAENRAQCARVGADRDKRYPETQLRANVL